MKDLYPNYKRGEISAVKKKITAKNRVLLDKYIKYCSVTAGESKLIKIERIILQFIDIVEKNLDKLSKQDVNHFTALLNHSKKTDYTKNEIKVYVKKFLRWHYKDMEMIENIKLKTNAFNDKKINENNLITPEEVEKLIRTATSLREKAFIMLLFESGARPQELQNLKWKNVSFKDDYTEITLYSNKTEKSRSFPVKESTIHLKRWKQEFCFPNLKPDDYVFPSPKDRTKPLSIFSFNWILKSLSKKAGFEKNIFPYLFRHTRATKLYEELPQQLVEKLMGHNNMAGIYAHISNKKAIEEMMNKIYHIEELPDGEKQELRAEIKILREHLEIATEGIENIGRHIFKTLKEADEKFPAYPSKEEKKHKQIIKKLGKQYPEMRKTSN